MSENSVSLFLLAPNILTGLAFAVCLLGASFSWLALHRWTRMPAECAPHAPFHVAIVGLFSLVLSFTLSDGWRRSDAAYAALLRESQEIAAMLPLLDAMQVAEPEPVTLVRTTLRAYLDQSLRQEWPAHNTRASEAAGDSLDRIRATLATRLIDPGPRAGAWRQVQDRLDGVQQARSARLVAGGLYGDLFRWGAIGALYVAGALGISAVHLGRRHAAAVALVIYAIAAGVALSLVSVSEQPYSGWDAIEPDRLVALLHRIPG